MANRLFILNYSKYEIYGMNTYLYYELLCPFGQARLD